MNIDQIKILYNQEGLSTTEIANYLKVSKWKVISFMRKNKLIRRSAAESNKIIFERTPLTFRIKTKLKYKEKMLKIAGLMLYWAEGNKGGSTVDISNSDDKILKLFLKTLRDIYQINESKLRILIYYHSNQNIQYLKDYWSSSLGISQKQFIKPYIRKDFNSKKINKMPFGLVHIRYNDKRLLIQILKDIDIISKYIQMITS
jgi:hypothetical protein